MLLRPQQTQRNDQRDGEYRKDGELPKRILKNLLARFEQFGKLRGKDNDTPANRDHGDD